MPTEDGPDNSGPVYVLPERAVLDPVSAGALALADVLPAMLEPGEDGALAVDMKAIASTVLGAVDALPRVPPWEGPRTVGGTVRDGQRPDPSVEVDAEPGVVLLTATVGMGDDTVVEQARVLPVDARQWFLAGLAACAAAESEDSDHLPYRRNAG